jgi:hypothetical protein
MSWQIIRVFFYFLFYIKKLQMICFISSYLNIPQRKPNDNFREQEFFALLLRLNAFFYRSFTFLTKVLKSEKKFQNF